MWIGCSRTLGAVHKVSFKIGAGQRPSRRRRFELELAEINVPDRDWRLGTIKFWKRSLVAGWAWSTERAILASRRIVALKRVLTYHSDSQQTLARFQREAQPRASLDHPNILPIYDVGTTDDGLPYFSMKFAAGAAC